jgi:hypothetical protein
VRKQLQEVRAVVARRHHHDGGSALHRAARREAIHRQVDHHRHDALAIDVFLEPLHMFDAILDHGDSRARPAGRLEPRRGGIAVIGLGGDQHPFHRLHLAHIREHSRLRVDHTLRRLHFDGIEGRARRYGNVVTVILAKPGSERSADGAGTDE